MKQPDGVSKSQPDAATSAVSTAFIKHGGFLKSFLRKFISRPQDIEDIAQEAFIRAYKLEQDSSIDHPKTLLFTIAKNIALNDLRSKARQVTDYIEECRQDVDSAISATTEEEIQALEGLKSYCEAVDSLPEQCRRVYLMRKVHGLSHGDIAERLNITVRTVERHLQKGVVRCRDHMSQQDVGQKKNSPTGITQLRKERVK